VRSRALTRLTLAAIIIATALAAATVVLLPPAAVPPIQPSFHHSWPVVRGAYHVHSNRSDGTGTLDEIAAAAARAGLQFVIMADHGNGMRAPEPASYRSGVLCVDGTEISTQYGHYVALGMKQTPYPLAGHPRDVIEDVSRFGGFGFAAHPGSPKAALRWDDWEAPFDGLEWLNADSEWRDEFWGSLGQVLLTYPFRPTETLAAMLDRPEDVLTRWNRASATRRVAAIAGADAHARLGLGRGADPYDDWIVAKVPAYDVSFRAFVNHVVLDHPLNGDAARDAAVLLAGVREGRVFTSIDGLAGLSAFEAKAVSGATAARIGEYLDPQGPVVLEARIAAPAGTTLIVRRDGEVLHEATADTLRLDIGTRPGTYRFEAQLPSQQRGLASVPWLLTNPVYVGLRERHARALADGAATGAATSRSPIATPAWRAEASEGSTSAVTTGVLGDGTPVLDWRFSLEAGGGPDQYAAMLFPLDGGLAAHDRLQLRVQSDAPRRVWAQMRAPGSRAGERWGATFYVDGALRSIELRFADFRPLGPVSSTQPPLDRIDSLLLVVDTLNSLPGTTGVLSIADLWLAR
jgi:hypothetical protein